MSDRLSPAVIRATMHQYGLYPKKRLGQNFLIDRNVLIKIADSCAISPEQYLVEIGPGLGGLTQELAKRCRGVLAIEVDAGLEPILSKLVTEEPNIRIIFQDVLKADIETELQHAYNLPEILPYQVCANIPYNITTPILFKLLENCPHMLSATLMMQKEVGERIMAVPGNKDYGRLTLSTAYYADVQHLMNVSRNCFHPKPEVDSVVLKIVPQHPKKVSINNEAIFKNFVTAAFQKRRKTILNITSGFFGISKEEAGQKLKILGLGTNLRPENLSLNDIANLLNAFAP
jgi:16S rRNA (adenine1518-N6/adenine1519-N6)-dimethyltransferase